MAIYRTSDERGPTLYVANNANARITRRAFALTREEATVDGKRSSFQAVFVVVLRRLSVIKFIFDTKVAVAGSYRTVVISCFTRI